MQNVYNIKVTEIANSSGFIVLPSFFMILEKSPATELSTLMRDMFRLSPSEENLKARQTHALTPAKSRQRDLCLSNEQLFLEDT